VAQKPGMSTQRGRPLPADVVEGPAWPGSDDPQTGFLFAPRHSLAWRLGTTYLLTTLLIVFTLSLAIYLAAAFYT